MQMVEGRAGVDPRVDSEEKPLKYFLLCDLEAPSHLDGLFRYKTSTGGRVVYIRSRNKQKELLYLISSSDGIVICKTLDGGEVYARFDLKLRPQTLPVEPDLAPYLYPKAYTCRDRRGFIFWGDWLRVDGTAACLVLLLPDVVVHTLNSTELTKVLGRQLAPAEKVAYTRKEWHTFI